MKFVHWRTGGLRESFYDSFEKLIFYRLLSWVFVQRAWQFRCSTNLYTHSHTQRPHVLLTPLSLSYNPNQLKKILQTTDEINRKCRPHLLHLSRSALEQLYVSLAQDVLVFFSAFWRAPRRRTGRTHPQWACHRENVQTECLRCRRSRDTPGEELQHLLCGGSERKSAHAYDNLILPRQKIDHFIRGTCQSHIHT